MGIIYFLWASAAVAVAFYVYNMWDTHHIGGETE